MSDISDVSVSNMKKVAASACLLLGFVAQSALAPLHAADAQRYTNAVAPLLDAAGGKPVGALQPGVAVDVLGQSGAATHVAVHGWSAQGASAVVMAAPNRHIVLINGYTGHAAPGTSQTVNGTAYQAVTVDGWAASNALVDDVQTVWKSAADLYAQKCAACHALPAAQRARRQPVAGHHEDPSEQCGAGAERNGVADRLSAGPYDAIDAGVALTPMTQAKPNGCGVLMLSFLCRV